MAGDTEPERFTSSRLGRIGDVYLLVTEEILSEYKGVLGKLGVRRHLVGEIINLLREEAEFVTIRSEDNLSPH